MTESSERKNLIVSLVQQWGHEWREEPFKLSAGALTHDYIDGKHTLAGKSRILDVASAILELVAEEGVEFDAVGGLAHGAIPLAVGVVLAGNSEKEWFYVREPKEHGKQLSLEGARLQRGIRVLLVDDVVTSGKSILKGLGAIRPTGAEVVFAVSVVDRSGVAGGLLQAESVPYRPLITYEDLGIEPIPCDGLEAKETLGVGSAKRA